MLIKELVDNALDACETAGTPPEITVTMTPQGFTVADNGPGMPTALIERSLDYDIRVSDKTYYVSPSRGQLGNALKCLWAAPYAVESTSPGQVEVSSLGLRHRDRGDGGPDCPGTRLEHTITDVPICRKGHDGSRSSPPR